MSAWCCNTASYLSGFYRFPWQQISAGRHHYKADDRRSNAVLLPLVAPPQNGAPPSPAWTREPQRRGLVSRKPPPKNTNCLALPCARPERTLCPPPSAPHPQLQHTCKRSGKVPALDCCPSRDTMAVKLAVKFSLPKAHATMSRMLPSCLCLARCQQT